MSFNKYSVYSVISVSAGHNAEDIQKILSVTDKLKQIKNISKVKEYIKSAFNIENCVQDYPIGDNAAITIKENEKIYSINLILDNKTLIYTFAK